LDCDAFLALLEDLSGKTWVGFEDFILSKSSIRIWKRHVRLLLKDPKRNREKLETLCTSVNI